MWIGPFPAPEKEGGRGLWAPPLSAYWQLENASEGTFTDPDASGVTAELDMTSAGVATEQSRVVEDDASKAIASAVYAAAEICASAGPLEAHAPTYAADTGIAAL